MSFRRANSQSTSSTPGLEQRRLSRPASFSKSAVAAATPSPVRADSDTAQGRGSQQAADDSRYSPAARGASNVPDMALGHATASSPGDLMPGTAELLTGGRGDKLDDVAAQHLRTARLFIQQVRRTISDGTEPDSSGGGAVTGGEPVAGASRSSGGSATNSPGAVGALDTPPSTRAGSSRPASARGRIGVMPSLRGQTLAGAAPAASRGGSAVKRAVASAAVREGRRPLSRSPYAQPIPKPLVRASSPRSPVRHSRAESQNEPTVPLPDVPPASESPYQAPRDSRPSTELPDLRRVAQGALGARGQTLLPPSAAQNVLPPLPCSASTETSRGANGASSSSCSSSGGSEDSRAWSPAVAADAVAPAPATGPPSASGTDSPRVISQLRAMVAELQSIVLTQKRELREGERAANEAKIAHELAMRECERAVAAAQERAAAAEAAALQADQRYARASQQLVGLSTAANAVAVLQRELAESRAVIAGLTRHRDGPAAAAGHALTPNAHAVVAAATANSSGQGALAVYAPEAQFPIMLLEDDVLPPGGSGPGASRYPFVPMLPGLRVLAPPSPSTVAAVANALDAQLATLSCALLDSESSVHGSSASAPAGRDVSSSQRLQQRTAATAAPALYSDITSADDSELSPPASSRRLHPPPPRRATHSAVGSRSPGAAAGVGRTGPFAQPQALLQHEDRAPRNTAPATAPQPLRVPQGPLILRLSDFTPMSDSSIDSCSTVSMSQLGNLPQDPDAAKSFLPAPMSFVPAPTSFVSSAAFGISPTSAASPFATLRRGNSMGNMVESAAGGGGGRPRFDSNATQASITPMGTAAATRRRRTPPSGATEGGDRLDGGQEGEEGAGTAHVPHAVPWAHERKRGDPGADPSAAASAGAAARAAGASSTALGSASPGRSARADPHHPAAPGAPSPGSGAVSPGPSALSPGPSAARLLGRYTAVGSTLRHPAVLRLLHAVGLEPSRPAAVLLSALISDHALLLDSRTGTTGVSPNAPLAITLPPLSPGAQQPGGVPGQWRAGTGTEGLEGATTAQLPSLGPEYGFSIGPHRETPITSGAPPVPAATPTLTGVSPSPGSPSPLPRIPTDPSASGNTTLPTPLQLQRERLLLSSESRCAALATELQTVRGDLAAHLSSTEDAARVRVSQDRAEFAALQRHATELAAQLAVLKARVRATLGTPSRHITEGGVGADDAALQEEDHAGRGADHHAGRGLSPAAASPGSQGAAAVGPLPLRGTAGAARIANPARMGSGVDSFDTTTTASYSPLLADATTRGDYNAPATNADADDAAAAAAGVEAPLVIASSAATMPGQGERSGLNITGERSGLTITSPVDTKAGPSPSLRVSLPPPRSAQPSGSNTPFFTLSPNRPSSSTHSSSSLSRTGTTDERPIGAAHSSHGSTFSAGSPGAMAAMTSRSLSSGTRVMALTGSSKSTSSSEAPGGTPAADAASRPVALPTDASDAPAAAALSAADATLLATLTQQLDTVSAQAAVLQQRNSELESTVAQMRAELNAAIAAASGALLQTAHVSAERDGFAALANEAMARAVRQGEEVRLERERAGVLLSTVRRIVGGAPSERSSRDDPEAGGERSTGTPGQHAGEADFGGGKSDPRDRAPAADEMRLLCAEGIRVAEARVGQMAGEIARAREGEQMLISNATALYANVTSLSRYVEALTWYMRASKLEVPPAPLRLLEDTQAIVARLESAAGYHTGSSSESSSRGNSSSSSSNSSSSGGDSNSSDGRGTGGLAYASLSHGTAASFQSGESAAASAGVAGATVTATSQSTPAHVPPEVHPLGVQSSPSLEPAAVSMHGHGLGAIPEDVGRRPDLPAAAPQWATHGVPLALAGPAREAASPSFLRDPGAPLSMVSTRHSPRPPASSNSTSSNSTAYPATTPNETPSCSSGSAGPTPYFSPSPTPQGPAPNSATAATASSDSGQEFGATDGQFNTSFMSSLGATQARVEAVHFGGPMHAYDLQAGMGAAERPPSTTDSESEDVGAVTRALPSGMRVRWHDRPMRASETLTPPQSSPQSGFPVAGSVSTGARSFYEAPALGSPLPRLWQQQAMPSPVKAGAPPASVQPQVPARSGSDLSHPHHRVTDGSPSPAPGYASDAFVVDDADSFYETVVSRADGRPHVDHRHPVPNGSAPFAIGTYAPGGPGLHNQHSATSIRGLRRTDGNAAVSPNSRSSSVSGFYGPPSFATYGRGTMASTGSRGMLSPSHSSSEASESRVFSPGMLLMLPGSGSRSTSGSGSRPLEERQYAARMLQQVQLEQQQFMQVHSLRHVGVQRDVMAAQRLRHAQQPPESGWLSQPPIWQHTHDRASEAYSPHSRGQQVRHAAPHSAPQQRPAQPPGPYADGADSQLFSRRLPFYGTASGQHSQSRSPSHRRGVLGPMAGGSPASPGSGPG